jgi:DNA primase
VPVLVEGPLDVLAVDTVADRAGVAPVAPCGTALTPEHATLITTQLTTQLTIPPATGVASVDAARVVVGFDPDPAGAAAARRAYHLLAPQVEELAALDLPVGEDPADLLTSNSTRLLQVLHTAHDRTGGRLLADRLLDDTLTRYTDRLGNAEVRVAALRDAAALIGRLQPRDVARQAHRAADRLGFDPAVVTDEILAAVTTDPRPPAAAGPHRASPSRIPSPPRHRNHLEGRTP